MGLRALRPPNRLQAGRGAAGAFLLLLPPIKRAQVRLLPRRASAERDGGSGRLSFSAPAEASGTARSSKCRYPPTLTMVTEAVGVLNERKGSSTAAIKRYIRHNYPGVDPIRLKYYLRKALLKGLEKGYLVRPLNSSAQGATGRFKLAAVKPKKVKPKRVQPAQGEDPAPKPEKKKAAAEGKARAENPKGKADAEGKENAASKKAKAESDPALAADPVKRKPREKTATEGKAPKKPRAPKTLQVKLAKPPSKAPPKGEAKTATKGRGRPKAGAEGEAEPPKGEGVKEAKGGQAKSQAEAPKARAPKAKAPKAGKKVAAAAKGKEKEAEGGPSPEDA
ncbi:protein B4-like [Crotalus tigris]|uniref:protein B4-like n=1 Tax=Crotalus tigris TaxID=88082 RepID=UPI00192F2812|nr:protein B4-like [Crotalus tigris]